MIRHYLVKYHARHDRKTVRRLLLIVARESGGNPRARNPYSGAAGLFQFLPMHWVGRYDPYNPRTNCSLAAQMYKRLGFAPWALTAYR
jgi:soluble lytic murein transglycosylase-like protein